MLLIKTPDGVYRKHLDQVIKRSVVSEPLQQTDPDTPRVELEIRDEQSSTATDSDLEKSASLPESTEPETSIIVGNNPKLPAEPDHKAAVEPMITAQPVLKPRELAIEMNRSTIKPNIVREHELQQPNLLLPANFARDSKPPDRLSYRKLGGT